MLTEGTFRGVGELVEVDVEHDAGAVHVGGAFDIALDAVAAGEVGCVGDEIGVVLGDGRVAELAGGLAEGEAGAGERGKQKRLHGCCCGCWREVFVGAYVVAAVLVNGGVASRRECEG